MQCAGCGTELEVADAPCPTCTEPEPEPEPEPPAAVPVTAPATRPPTRRQRAFADRPPGYPNPFVWLRSGILRDWRGPLGALISTWFYLPVAIALAVYGAVALGIVGFFAGGLGLHGLVPQQLHSAPLVGTAIDGFLSRSGGILVGLLGIVLGMVGGFLAGLLLPWTQTVHDPGTLAGSLLGILVSAVLLGIGYTLYRVMLERWLLRLSGARRPSWRESQLLQPILQQCARDLGLPNVPRLLVDDSGDANAYAYTRHIVVNKGLFEEFDYHRGAIAAVLSHELVHWRNGDAVTAAFVRGVALPLYLIYMVPTWVMRKYPHPLVKLLMIWLFWPFLLTVRYVVMPLQAMDTRRAELRADQGAVLTGHRAGMRRVLSRHRSFEGGRTGWDEAVCATHPSAELRLEQLEEPGRAYPLPEDAALREPAGDERPVPEDPRLLLATRTLVFAPVTRASRTGWIAIGATTVVCFLLLGVLAAVQWALFSPENAVSEYFDALARHDGVAAQRLASDTGSEVSALPPEAIRASGYQPPSQVTISSVTAKGDDAVAVVTFRLGDQPASARLTLKRDTRATDLVFHGWHLVGGGSVLAVTAPGTTSVRVNGVDVATPRGEGLYLAAPPGLYQVSVPDNPLTEAPPVTVAVDLTGQGRLAQLSPVLKPAASDKINQSVRQVLDRCAAQTVLEPAGCPFGYNLYGDLVGPAHWTITTYPQLDISLNGPTQARVSTRTEGQVVVSGTRSYFGGTGPFTQALTFSVGGTATTDGNSITFNPQN